MLRAPAVIPNPLICIGGVRLSIRLRLCRGLRLRLRCSIRRSRCLHCQRYLRRCRCLHRCCSRWSLSLPLR
jgi:hypothetical protein